MCHGNSTGSKWICLYLRKTIRKSPSNRNIHTLNSNCWIYLYIKKSSWWLKNVTIFSWIMFITWINNWGDKALLTDSNVVELFTVMLWRERKMNGEIETEKNSMQLFGTETSSVVLFFFSLLLWLLLLTQFVSRFFGASIYKMV